MSNLHSSLHSQILFSLQTTKSLHPTSTWLSTFLSTQRSPPPPLTSLVSTATFRLLNANITTCLDTSSKCCLPPEVQNVNVKERKLSGPIVVQVLDVEDVGKSRWEQIEAIEALERGEGMKGREIVRVAGPEEEDGTSNIATPPPTSTAKKGGPHKLLFQDAAGNVVYGFEMVDIAEVSLSMNIGAKIVLKNAVVARGVVLLEPSTASAIGGKIEALHKQWKDERKERLKKAIADSERAEGR